jgi:hypothetical protein
VEGAAEGADEDVDMDASADAEGEWGSSAGHAPKARSSPTLQTPVRSCQPSEIPVP